jgi:hypothetical protein
MFVFALHAGTARDFAACISAVSAADGSRDVTGPTRLPLPGSRRARLGFGLLAATALSACVTGSEAGNPRTGTTRVDDGVSLRENMSRAEVEAMMGPPDGMQPTSDQIGYQYLGRRAPGRGTARAEYYVIFQNDRLVGWGIGRVRTVPGPSGPTLLVELLGADGIPQALEVSPPETSEPVPPSPIAAAPAATPPTSSEAPLEHEAGRAEAPAPDTGQAIAPPEPPVRRPEVTPTSIAAAPSAEAVPHGGNPESGALRKMLAGVRRGMEPASAIDEPIR